MTGSSDNPECRLCAVAAGEGDWPNAATLVAHVGEIIVLVQPGLHEVLVAPFEHAATLGTLSEVQRGRLLAALRGVVLVVEAKGGKATVEVAPVPPEAKGHLCLRVLPQLPSTATTRFDDVDALARELHHMMQ